MANILGDSYYSSMDREYQMKPEIGVTLFEGVEGRFPQSLAAKIKMGAGAVELQLNAEDFSKGLGAESYGEEARQDIKDLAEFNDVRIHSVHMSHVPNLSGLGKQGFDERTRDEIVTEIAKEIDFAGDVTKGGSVVVHTGEFPRPIAFMHKEFEAYPGEAKEATMFLANDETGQLAQIDMNTMKKEPIRKEGVPIWVAEERQPKKEDFMTIQPTDLLKEIKRDQDGVPRKFMEKHHIVPNETTNLNEKQIKSMTDEELAVLGFYMDHGDEQVEKARLEVEQTAGFYEHYKRQGDEKLAEYYRHANEESAKSLQQVEMQRKQIVPIKEVALKRTADTLAQAGVMAYETTKEKKLENPLTMTPENISPYEYGSHPDEMIEMVQKARKQMVERMTKKQIEDPGGRMVINENGEKIPFKLDNPFYKKGMSEDEAEELAEKHIKATLDTQHLGMWERHFKKQPGETEEQRQERFDKWYLEQVDKLSEKGIIGNVHVVDGMGRGHSHLPIGQGRYPVAEAIEKLREKGKVVPFMSSEGHGEGPERQLTEAWAATGKGIYSAMVGGRQVSWTEVQGSYLGQQRPPGYVVGEYAKGVSPDFTLWSGVQLE
jgi:hypothetical protein